MDPAIVREWAAALVPYLAFFTAGWAILTYRRSKKVEVARLQKQIFDDLYLSGKFEDIRILLDLDYAGAVEPILEKAMADKSPLSPDERQTLIRLDNFLNLIEYVLYLEQDTRLINAKDRRALLSYWLSEMKSSKRSVLQDYIAEYDYERLAGCLGVSKKVKSADAA